MYNSPIFNMGLALKGRNINFTSHPKPKPLKIFSETQRETPLHIEPKQLNKLDTSHKNLRAISYSSRKQLNITQRISQDKQKIKKEQSVKLMQREEMIRKRIETNLENRMKKIQINVKPKKCTCGDCTQCLKDFTYFLQIVSNDQSLPEISSKSWCIWRRGTCKLKQGKKDRFLHYYGKRIHKVRQIASLTKMITAMAVLDFLNKHDFSPDNITYRVKKSSTLIGGTSASLQIGQVYTITQLLYGLMLPSGNDAAIALSEVIGLMQNLKVRNKPFNPTMDKWYEECVTNPNKSYSFLFIHMMNEKCQKLGLLDTHVYNSHGNDAFDQLKNVSTCNELAKISAEFMSKYEFLKHVVTTKKYTVERYDKNWENTNKLLDDGFQGIKTGITETAGPCLSAAYKDLIIVVLNSKSMNQRWIEVKKLARWIFRKGL